MKTHPEKDTGIGTFTIDVTLNYASLLLNLVIASITSIILARSLGPSGKGIYSLCIAIPSMAAVFVGMGINSSNIYFIAKKKHPIGIIVGNSCFYSIGVGICTALLLVPFIPLFAEHLLKGASPAFLYITLAIIPTVLLCENIGYIFVAYRNMLQYAIIGISRSIIYCLLLIVFIFHSELLIYEAIVAFILGLLFCILIGTYFLLKKGYLAGLAVERRAFIEVLKFGFKQHLGTIAQFFNYRLDLLIVAALLTPAAVGLYSISVMVGEIVWFIPRSLGQVLFPKIASSDNETANEYTPYICRTTVLIILPAIAVLYGISDILIPFVFTSDFLPSVLPLKLLLPGILFFSISKILGNDLLGRGYPLYNSIAACIALVLTVVLDLLLIPIWGIEGAALATSITYIFHAIFTAFLYSRVTGIGLFRLLRFQKDDFVYYKKVLISILKRR